MAVDWDAENRLVTVRPIEGTEAAGMSRVDFGYDSSWRRVRKTVTPWDANTSNWASAPSLDRRLLWSGWRMLLEFDILAAEPDEPLRALSWGLDLAGLGGAQGGRASAGLFEQAGTIGGLLAVRVCDVSGAPEPDDPVDYVYLYDALGNVGQVVDWSHDAQQPGAALAARYQYDPYGGVTKAQGDYAADNAWRFSTKQWDDETGLGYWGYRYYSPSLGRWVSRDPIGSLAIPHSGGPAPVLTRDGINIGLPYHYVYNSPAALVDPLGLFATDPLDRGGVRLPPGDPDWGVGNGELDPKDLNPKGFWRSTCPSVDLGTAQRLADEAWIRHMYHKSQPGGANDKAAAYWHKVYAKWAHCIARKGSDVSVCYRRMRKDGGDCADTCTIGVANAIGWLYEGATHAYLATNPCCLSEGYGLSGGEKKDAPPSQEHAGFSCPYRCQRCHRQNRILQYGSGAGKQGLIASDAEILDCIKNAKAKEDYSVLSYNCQHWAWQTAHECGLFCPDRR